MFKEQLKNRLLQKQKEGLHRAPREIEKKQGKHLFMDGKKVINFASNDYLGLSVSKELSRKVSRNFLKYGTSSSSSRLVSGNYSIINLAEKEYARYFGYDDALFFPSGFQANIGILSGFFQKGDRIIFDKHIHASSVKGMALSGARFYGYNHNSMTHLGKRLEKEPQQQPVVLTESLFSMDGDFIDTEAFLDLKNRYGFFSIIDEAHAFGAAGQKGRGLAHDIADIAVGTFGKALGFFGAFVLLPQGLKEYLFNFCSPLVYSTTLPEAHAASAIDLLEIISGCDNERESLAEAGSLMKQRLKEEGYSVEGDAHILALEIGEEEKAVEISRRLLEKKLFVLPARYPTVPIGRAILRIGMTALHTKRDIEAFVNALKEVYENRG